MLWRVCLVLGLVFVAAVVWQGFARHGHPWMFVYPAVMLLLLAVITRLRRGRAVASHDQTTRL